LVRAATGAQPKDIWSLDFKAPDCRLAHQKVPTLPAVNGVPGDVDCGFDVTTGVFAGVDMGASIHIDTLSISQNLPGIALKNGLCVPPNNPKAVPSATAC
jgi:hypothetical protein